MATRASADAKTNMNRPQSSRDRHLTLIIAIVFTSFASAFNANNEVLIEYREPNSCKYNEYFDTVSLSCSRCDASENLVPAANHLGCVCDEFSKTIGLENRGNPLCVACDYDMTATADGKDCVLRANSTCRCSSDQIQLDRNINGVPLDTVLCVTCVQGTYPSSDCSKCLPCDTRPYNGHVNCACPSATHVRFAQSYCLRKDDVADWADIRGTYLVKFKSENVDSYYLRSELQIAVYLCKRKDKTACEHLSNICALTLYTDSVACMFFMHMPRASVWLFYNRQDTVAVMNNTKISQRYSLRREDNSSVLDFAIARFALNGEFLSVGRPALPCQLLRNVRFGVNLSRKCRTTSVELLNAQVELLSPYLAFKEDNKSFIHALPVIVRSTNHENVEEISHQQLVRKFFLVDNVSGFKASSTSASSGFTRASELSVLRYMKSLTVLVNVRNGKDHGRIFAPLLIVEYDELTQQDLHDTSDIVIDYKVTFTLKDNDIDYNVEITIGVLTGMALIISGVRAWNYYKRNRSGNLSITVLLWFLIYAMGAVGSVISFVCIGVCAYLFAFYKGQTVPHVLLPDENTERNIRTYMNVAIGFKIVEMMGFVYQHWSLSVFFVDWEQPRTTHSQPKYDSPHTSLRKLYSNRFSDENRSSRITSDMIASKRKKRSHRTSRNASPSEAFKSSFFDKHEMSKFSSVYSLARSPLQETSERVHNFPISIWRTYFVANEWCKLQTRRRINVALQSIYTLCILQIFDLESWMLAVPESTGASKFTEEKTNFTLRYAISTFVYVSVYFAQWLIRITFYERYVRNRLQKFVDLCSIANISVFVLAHDYYGFYIHGRSVHGFADTDLPTLINDLKKEEDNLCAHRGLVPGTTDQTFIVSLTQSFKSLYDELVKQKDHGSISVLKESDASSTNWEQLSETRSKLKLFLTQFLDHCSKNEDYIIKEQHTLEKLCDIFLVDAKDKSIFYIDNNYSFSRVVLYGNEWLLATFEITVFAFFLALCNSYILACVATVLVSQLFVILITCNVKRNLCNKSLLDKRFLM